MAVSKIFSGEDILNGRRTVLGEDGPHYPPGSGGLHVLSSTDGITVDGRYLAGPWAEGRGGVPTASGDSATAASGVDASLYLAALPGCQHVLYGVAFGYDSTPTSGQLTIESPSGTTIFAEPVTASGPGFFTFENGLRSEVNTEMRVLLKNGHSSKTLSLMGRKVE